MLVSVSVVELVVVFVLLSQAEVGRNRCASKHLLVPLKVRMFGEGSETWKRSFIPRRAASAENEKVSK